MSDTNDRTMAFVAVTPPAAASAGCKGRLRVVGGPDQGRLFPLGDAPLSIGSAGSCHVVLADKFVSRRHAEVAPTATGFIVRDLGSRNGTTIGSARVSEAVLAPGATFKVGGTTLRLEVADPDGLASQPDASPAAVIGQHTAETIHEIKNLLVGVKASAKVLARFEDAAQPAAAIVRGMDSMSRCVTKILNFARSEQFCPEACPLAALVGDVLLFWAPAMQAHGIRLERESLAGLVVWGDPRQLRELLSNLVENAVQAMLEGGTLRVGTGRESPGVLAVRVADSGAGVPETVRTRIFEPFFTTRSSGQGMGLGLAICRRVAAAHGGSISCGSAAGGGAEFTVLLPEAPA
jgi:signal transduction histidine kinase